MSLRRSILLGLIGLAGTAPAAHAQSTAEWQAQQVAAEAKADRIMVEANQQKGLLSQYMTMRQAYAGDDSPAFRMIFGQYIGWYLSFLGDYPLAVQSFSIAEPARPGDNASPLDGGYAARPALDEIPALASNYQIVMLNEAHNVAMTRSLTVALLSHLYAQGFRYFAAETLSQKDAQLQTRGYPIDDSGFYTQEPVYAEMVRTALKLGYKVIAYEATSTITRPDQREAEQARHIYEQVFKEDPHARLVINAGYEHIVKAGVYLGGESMAEHLHRLTDAPILAIDQTAMYPRPSSQNNHPYYTAVMKQLHPDAPIVFVDAKDKPWSLRSAYDVNVFFPPEKLERGRPTWLTLWGLRQPHWVSGDGCRGHYACLVEARYSNEGPDAIPADRMLLQQTPMTVSISGVEAYSSTQGVPSGVLYLRPGSYQISFIVGGEKVLHKDTITVQPQP